MEQDNCEGSCENCHDKLHVGGLGQSHHVQEISFGQETKLVEPTGLLILDIAVRDSLELRVLSRMVVEELFVCLVGLVENTNLLYVGYLDLGVSSLVLLVFFFYFILVGSLLGLNRHDRHKVVRGVGHLRAGITDSGEVVDSQRGLVEIDNLTGCHEHELVEYLIDVRVGLMDSRDHCSATGG